LKKLVPLLIALLGLGTGVGAGMALKPAPAPEAAETCALPSEGDAAAEPCAAADPFAPETAEAAGAKGELAYVPIEKPFVVPVFAGEKAVAMVVVSLSIATEGEKAASAVEAMQPRLRDSFLKVMFRHANSGGFDGSYTTSRKLEDLKSALLGAAREVMPDAPVDEVLITEIARQDG
jgi:flagellar basal body-associated protein FliL